MRGKYLQNIRRVVIKIGSRVLTDDTGALDGEIIQQLSSDMAAVMANGIQVVLVSSGAVAAGRNLLGMTERPRTIPQKQAAAAVGQPRLMRLYEESFSRHGLVTAQVLLTSDDLSNRNRFLNARATIDQLLACGAVPIINENDTVAVSEIKFGDNDNLSALVTNLVEAQLLVILTDIEGFYSSDPNKDPNARLIPIVKGITRDIEKAAGSSGSSVGTGGMATKVAAAKKTGKSGVATIVAPGKRKGAIEAAISTEDIGTLFLPAKEGINSRKHWIAYTLRPSGKLFVDNGAKRAILEKGTSLLPSGITGIEGRFDRGARIRICGEDGIEFARGITDYGCDEIKSIKGRKSSDIEEILGYRYGDEVIHRDNLVII